MSLMLHIMHLTSVCFYIQVKLTFTEGAQLFAVMLANEAFIYALAHYGNI